MIIVVKQRAQIVTSGHAGCLLAREKFRQTEMDWPIKRSSLPLERGEQQKET